MELCVESILKKKEKKTTGKVETLLIGFYLTMRSEIDCLLFFN